MEIGCLVPLFFVVLFIFFCFLCVFCLLFVLFFYKKSCISGYSPSQLFLCCGVVRNFLFLSDSLERYDPRIGEWHGQSHSFFAPDFPVSL